MLNAITVFHRKSTSNSRSHSYLRFSRPFPIEYSPDVLVQRFLNGIRARRHGMTSDAGARSPGQNPPPLSNRSLYPRHELGIIDDPTDRKTEQENRVPNPLEARCRDAGPEWASKGKQQIVAVSCRKRFLEAQTAVPLKRFALEYPSNLQVRAISQNPPADTRQLCGS